MKVNSISLSNRGIYSISRQNKKLSSERNFKPSMKMDEVSFNSSNRAVLSQDGILENCNYTNMFRADINWIELAKYLEKRYSDAESVKIICYGCSDGSEPYTLALALTDTLGEDKSRKFFPIVAKDMDEAIINQARSGEIELNYNDIEKLNYVLKNTNTEKVFCLANSDSKTNSNKYRVSKELREKVAFSQGNILEDEIDADILMFRNAWTFNSLYDQKSLAKKLYEESNVANTVIIGNMDIYLSNAKEYLTECGYKEITNDVNKDIGFSADNLNTKTLGNPCMLKSFHTKGLIYEKA